MTTHSQQAVELPFRAAELAAVVEGVIDAVAGPAASPSAPSGGLQ